MILRKIAYIIFFFLHSKFAISEEFYSKLQKAKNDSEAIAILLKIAEKKESENLDSALRYYKIIYEVAKNNVNKDTIHKKYFIKTSIFGLNKLAEIYTLQKKLEKALEHQFNALRIAGMYKLTREQCNSFQNIGNTYYHMNSLDLALKYYKLSLSFAYAISDSNEISKSLQKIAEINFQKQNYIESLSLLNKTLFYINKNDISKKAYIYSKIGDVYKELNNFDESINYYQKSLSIYTKLNSDKDISFIYLKLSELYNCYELIEKSISYAFKALSYYEQEQNLAQIAYCHTLIANNYLFDKNYSNSLKHFKLAEETDSTSLNYQFYEGIISCYLALIDSVKDKEQKQKLIKLAKFYNKKFYKYCPAYNFVLKEKIYNFYYIIYNKLENLYFVKKYADSLLYVKAKIFEKKQSILRNYLLFKFQSEKENFLKEKFLKEKIWQQETERLSTKISIIIILLFFISAFLVLFIVLFLVSRNKYVKKIKFLQSSIVSLEDKLKEKVKIIENSEKELQKTKLLIEKSNKEIKRDIEYSKLIQSYVLPNFNNKNVLKKFDYFITYIPAGNLSGDFYWYAYKNNRYYFAIGDTSSHNSPGALLSSLCITILNEAVFIKEINDIDNIAKYLFNQSFRIAKNVELNFSITDLTIITITEQNELEIISINSNIFLYNSQKNKMIEFKDSKIPYNIIDENTVFEIEKSTLNKNDIIYLFTDGFKEQTGGNEGKKYQIKNFKEFLASISRQTMMEQKFQISIELSRWLNAENRKYEQTDNITIIGLKVIS